MKACAALMIAALIGAVLVLVASAPAPAADPPPADSQGPLTELRAAATPVPPSAWMTGSGMPAGATPTETVAQASASVTDLLARYLAERFGTPGLQASWYADVRSVSVRMNTAVIRTDLTDAPGDQDKADRICLAASLFPKSEQGARVGDLDVQVYGQRDRLLASSRGGNGQQARAQQTYIMPAVSDPNYGLP